MAYAFALCAMVLPHIAAAATASDTIRSFYQTLQSNMQNGPSLGQQGRVARLAPIVPRVFDIPYMTQLAIGPAWATLPNSQRQQVMQAFERYVTAVYAERFDKYAGERLEVIGETPTSYGTVVKTQIVKADGEPVTLNYLMVNGAGADHKSAMCTSAAPSANSPRDGLIFRRRCAPKVSPVSSPSSTTRLSLWRQHSPGALPTAKMTAANHAERCTGPVR